MLTHTPTRPVKTGQPRFEKNDNKQYAVDDLVVRIARSLSTSSLHNQRQKYVKNSSSGYSIISKPDSLKAFMAVASFVCSTRM
jgi:hypothetical protein